MTHAVDDKKFPDLTNVERKTMLSSGVPSISEYLELESVPDFERLFRFSTQFRQEVGSLDLFSKLYSFKWVDDPFSQWSRRWEYVYVLQRLENWWSDKRTALEIADAGSGFTFFPFYLQRANPAARITCIDADTTAGRAIDEATKFLGQGPTFSLENLEALDKESESLDAVFSVSVIEHTSNPVQVILEIHRVLRPGGIFVCTFDVSFETGNQMHVSRVEQLVDRLHDLFRPQDANIIPFSQGVRNPERVTTTWVAEEHPERLPWKNPRLVWLYDAFRGRFRSRLYRPMTFYCGSFVKP